MLMQLRAASPETEQDVVMSQLTELAEMHPGDLPSLAFSLAFIDICILYMLSGIHALCVCSRVRKYCKDLAV